MPLSVYFGTAPTEDLFKGKKISSLEGRMEFQVYRITQKEHSEQALRTNYNSYLRTDLVTSLLVF